MRNEKFTDRTANGSPIVEKTAQLLQAVADARTGISLSALVETLGVPRSTIYRILNSLHVYGLVSKPNGGGLYSLGPKFVELARRMSPHSDRATLVEAAQPILAAAADRIGESFKLTVPEGRDMMTIHAAQSPADLGLFVKIGGSTAKHVGSAGKVALAYSDLADLAAYCDGGLLARTAYTITDPDTLRDTLTEVRRAGYAEDNQESTLGVRAFAAPVFDADQRFLAAVSVPYIGEATPDRSRTIRREVLDSAAMLMKAVGGRHPLPK